MVSGLLGLQAAGFSQGHIVRSHHNYDPLPSHDVHVTAANEEAIASISSLTPKYLENVIKQSNWPFKTSGIDHSRSWK